MICEYELSEIRNLRLEPETGAERVRIRFDYNGGSSGFGDEMSREKASAIVEQIRNAAGMARREQDPHVLVAPEQSRTSDEPHGVLPAATAGVLDRVLQQ